MEIQKLIKHEIDNQKLKTQTLKGDTFPGRVDLRIEEDRLRNMLVAEQFAGALAEQSIQYRNHMMFQDLKKLFPATFEYCVQKVTHQ
jgi:hypothetical protein